MDVRIIVTGNGDIRAYPVRYLPRQSREGVLTHCTQKPTFGDGPSNLKSFSTALGKLGYMYVHLNTFIQLVSYIDYLNIRGKLAGYSLGLNSNNQNKTNNQSILGRQCQARSLACSWGWPPRTPSSSPPPSSCSVGIFNLRIFLLSSCVVGIFNL